MTALLLGLFLGALPAHASQRYRMEIGGEQVGYAQLSILCKGGGCTATWESALRLPEVGGGGTMQRRIDIETDPEGRARLVRLQMSTPDGRRTAQAGAGPIPASLVELLLSWAGEGERRCLRVRDEESGTEGEACARRRGAWLEGEVLGEPLRFRALNGVLPEEVVLPAQATRFEAAADAELPARPPRLFGSVVPRSSGGGPVRFCEMELEREEIAAAPSNVPRSFPSGENCRQMAAAYLRLATERGLTGRHVVGVAHDGQSFVWHQWVELSVGGRWWAVDPAFGQVPARGARFALARFSDGDVRGVAAAGRKVLACWRRAQVTGGP